MKKLIISENHTHFWTRNNKLFEAINTGSGIKDKFIMNVNFPDCDCLNEESILALENIITDSTINTKSYYKGKDSLYKFAQEWDLNPYEFDIIKRVVRCRHKGNFADDLQKTKDVIDIYIKEQKQ